SFEGEVYHWSPEDGLTKYRDHTNRLNGTAWLSAWGLVGCEWFGRRLVFDDLKGNVSTIVDSYEGKRLNGPNDVWVSPRGAIYFTDPVFGPPPGEIELAGQHIYMYPGPGGDLLRASDALELPNGLVGTPDGKLLYVTESGGVTYRYSIRADGSLADKTYFAPRSGDGMTLDEQGNVYIADDYDVWVYAPDGTQIEHIRPPEPPSNVEFGGPDNRTLFITAYTSVYGLEMSVEGAYRPPEPGWVEPVTVVPPGAEVAQLATGYTFTEGPAVDRNGDVYFTDVPQSVIYKYSPGTGISTYRTNTSRGNGLYFDADWNMAVCEGAGKRVALDNRAGKVSSLADSYDGRPLNAPNDLWIAPNGGIYFTDPLFVSPGDDNQGVSRVYYIPPGGGDVVAVVDDLALPNGLIGTPDGKTLYVADYAASGKTWRYDIEPDGSLSGKTLFADHPGDGMTLDERGNVYVVSGSRVWIHEPDGSELQSIAVPETASNVTFGGPEGRTLYITATSSLYQMELLVRGAYAPGLPPTPTPTSGSSPTAESTPTATETEVPPPTPSSTRTPEPQAEWELFCPVAMRGEL
ncbi:MAG: SMP-30/gluconolactonase/LRE family protein, partial [Anaerolineae bacterium]